MVVVGELANADRPELGLLLLVETSSQYIGNLVGGFRG